VEGERWNSWKKTDKLQLSSLESSVKVPNFYLERDFENLRDKTTPSFKAISGEIFSNLPQKIGIGTMISENMKPANIERRKKHLELVFDRYGLKLESYAQLATDWIMTGRLGTKKTLAQVLFSVNHL